ncbi:ABC transporter substrate-binding protein [Mucilaginibacter ginkgonis]|uniref:ABC transporter substrate-binding protein n=1 Tax=Mucilaginibacter ginkgonis TaxID=2682091 RepID=A0A6I4I4Z0_9SPHI|nr:ABC transporter substrate-binding protein [Mucilaginibacter ginkgonis]QQL48317.1 ABC transporter substrate-binding protein [Mucilaginibacter ginkgonis]
MGNDFAVFFASIMVSGGQEIMDLAIQGLSEEDANPRFIEELQDRVDIVQHKLKFIERKPSVAFINTLDFTEHAGNSLLRLISAAGGMMVNTNLYSGSAWESLIETNPEIIVVAPQNNTIEDTMKQMTSLLDQKGFSELAAVKNNRVYIADGNQYFYQPRARIVDSLEILAEIINPKQFIFGYEGQGWVRFDM